MRYETLSADLLTWYDRNARVMPWRVGPSERRAGTRPDPYRVWLSEVMLQQTTVAAVRDYFHRFTARWPTVGALAAAEDADVMGEWAGLGYYARARNLLKCARAVAADHGGRFPATREELLQLPGIGPYTAAAIAAIAFDQPATVVDGNVERVMARLFEIETPLPRAKPELTALADRLTPQTRPGDYAQAVMDLGATICTPTSPACGICPWMAACQARAAGTQATLPRKAPKKPKPTRRGIAYLARRTDGAWLLERRPDKGLLGGMLGWPGSDWTETPAEAPPIEADWRDPGAEVHHTFTHFHLQLALRVAAIPDGARPSRGAFVPTSQFRPSDLPTVMRKAYDLASATLGGN
ncbi:MAG: A/G-specific adenine glycosylase [Rhodobacter sp.]|nr:A/G-specific adenine glycosylase [Rhodobacter sp.]